MKSVGKAVVLVLGAALMLCLAGCGTGFPNGLLYTDITIPIAVNSGDRDEINNIGEAEGVKILGLFVFGDVSYDRAVANATGGDFGSIQRVEYYMTDIAGCGKFGIRVYGKTKSEKTAQDRKDK